MKPGFSKASFSRAAHETIGFLSVRRLTDALPVSAWWPDSTAFVVSSAVCLVLISSVTVFSPFLPLFSRGTKSEWGLLARPRAVFCGGAKKRRSIVLFLGGTANPEGVA